VMLLAGCLHPPGGACALFVAAAPSTIQDHGYLFALWPIAVNSLLLLAVAVVVNNLTGRRYPHLPRRESADPDALERSRLQTADIQRAMDRLDAGLDVMAADVVELVRDAEAHALDRRLGRLRCGDLMVRDPIVLRPDETIYRARLLMNNRHLKALPVVDDDRRVVGMVTVFDLFNLDLVRLAPVSSVMTSPVRTVHEDHEVADLVESMTGTGRRTLPVTDDDGRLVGILSRAELIAALHRALVESAR
jgi:CBS domain-containing membrane protein